MRRWGAGGLLGALLIGCGAAAAAPAPRVVSLGPAITDQLCLLGAASNLVGATTYCQVPADRGEVVRIGTVTGVSAEPILALRPDLVLATSLTHPRDVARLERVGLRVVRFDYARTFADIAAQFVQLGGLVGREEPARGIIRAAEARLAAVADRVAGRPEPSVFVEIGTRPLFTADRESFIHDLLVRAGGRNVAADAKGGFFSREQVLALNPDVIIVVTMGVAAEEERAQWLATPALRAAASRRVHVMDAYTVCSPTPLRFAEATEELAALLHPPGGTKP